MKSMLFSSSTIKNVCPQLSHNSYVVVFRPSNWRSHQHSNGNRDSFHPLPHFYIAQHISLHMRSQGKHPANFHIQNLDNHKVSITMYHTFTLYLIHVQYKHTIFAVTPTNACENNH